MPNLYVIAGCNGAGKTTTSYTVLPEPDTIQRRYKRGLHNFFNLYRNLADSWIVYDNSGTAPLLVAKGRGATVTNIHNPDIWGIIEKKR